MPDLDTATGPARFRVLVTGSRTWTDTATITAALEALRAEHGDRLTVVHGACPRGADAIADDWTVRTGTDTERWPADWRAGRGAGMARNTAMVATGPARCLAFIRDASPGASHCAATAEAAGIPTDRHTHPQPPPAPGGRLLSAALAAAARGWHVFPLRPGTKVPAFPDHGAAHCTGRDPRCRDGHTGWEARATTDPDRIRRAWTARPYGIGVACGPSGLLVVDLDTPKPEDPPRPPEWDLPGVTDGADALAVLCERAGQPYPGETYTVRTGRGGTHLYFRQPEHGPALGNTSGGTTTGLGWKIDTRGQGGLVVAAGSVVAGNPYTTVLDLDPAPLPDWLTDALRPKPMPAPAVIPRLPDSRAGRWIGAALAAEVARVTNAPGGAHNAELYAAARILGELVAGGAIAEHDVRDALRSAAAGLANTAGCDCTPGTIERTITSGLRAGARRPRQVAA